MYSFRRAASASGKGLDGGSERGDADVLDEAERADAPSGPDAEADAAPRCKLDLPFGKPVLVPSLNKAGRHSLSARPAGDFLYFVSDRHAAEGLNFSNDDIYRARFQGDAFTDITQLKAVSTANKEDVAPTESADGLTLYFAVGDISVRRIKRSTRTARGLEYAPPGPLAVSSDTIVPGAEEESDPYLVGQHLYFTSRAGASGAISLVYVVDVGANGPVASTARVVARPYKGVLRYPVVNAAETTLYFVEYVNGSTPKLFAAGRDLPDNPFTMPTSQPLPDIVGYEDLNVTGLSADECDLYLAARLGPDKSFDIYRSRRGVP